MSLSVHDNYLLSYCVLAKEQEIRFHTVDPYQTPPERVDVVFTGVACYHFTLDNFQTIIFGIEEINAEAIYTDNRELFEDGRRYGWPGVWNCTDESVLDYLVESRIKGFDLSSSLGMVGWVLARSMSLIGGVN